MIKKLTTLTMMAFATCFATAQTTVNVNLVANDTVDMRVFIYPLGDMSDDNTPMTRNADGSMSQTIATAETGLYNVVCVTGTSQYSLPVYIAKDSASPVALTVNLDGTCPQAVTTAKSKAKKDKAAVAVANANLNALNGFNLLYYKQSREVWTNAAKLSADDIRRSIKNYSDKAAEIAGNDSIDENVKQYIAVWAYLQGAECVNVYNRVHDVKLPMFSTADAQGMLAEPHTVLDSHVALLHSSSVSTAAQALPKGTLDSRLQYINERYTNTDMRKGIQRILLNSFIRNYDYTKGYQAGLEAITSAKEKFGIDQAFVDSFRERVSAIPGAAFPDVALIDAEGNKVSMEQFRGKYVYIDLWASWCVPCVKEIPHLQKLEQELQNDNVVFVSISTDSTEDPWLKKMKQLDLHGNQWMNKDGKLCDKLNVSGIPHFLIYDKEGHLHTYNAPRPSTGSALKTILEELK